MTHLKLYPDFLRGKADFVKIYTEKLLGLLLGVKILMSVTLYKSIKRSKTGAIL